MQGDQQLILAAFSHVTSKDTGELKCCANLCYLKGHSLKLSYAHKLLYCIYLLVFYGKFVILYCFKGYFVYALYFLFFHTCN